MQDYYDILGVPKHASFHEIKKSYIKLALETHPDVNTDKDKAHELFIELNQAYQILSNHQSRMEYDKYIEGCNIDYDIDTKFDVSDVYDPMAGWRDWQAFVHDSRSIHDKIFEVVLNERNLPSDWSEIMDQYIEAGKYISMGIWLIILLLVMTLGPLGFAFSLIMGLPILFVSYHGGAFSGAVVGGIVVEIIKFRSKRQRRRDIGWD